MSNSTEEAGFDNRLGGRFSLRTTAYCMQNINIGILQMKYQH